MPMVRHRLVRAITGRLVQATPRGTTHGATTCHVRRRATSAAHHTPAGKQQQPANDGAPSKATPRPVARRHCQHCGLTHATGERCKQAKAAADKRRDHDHGNSTARGYDAAWRTLAKQVITEEGRCRHCGHTGDPTNPLTGDHILALILGGARLDRANVQCLCRSCNSAKRSRQP